MAGYKDTREMIISVLTGRPVGTEIQPEDQEAYELNMLEYIKSIELIGTSTLIGVADAGTVPVQPSSTKVCYIAGMSPSETLTFANFLGQNGSPLSVTTAAGEGKFIVLIWNTQYWEASSFVSNLSNTVVQEKGTSTVNVMSQKAVTDELGDLELKVDGVQANYESGGYLNNDGSITQDANWAISSKILINVSDSVEWGYGIIASPPSVNAIIYEENDVVRNYYGIVKTDSSRTFSAVTRSKYVRVSFKLSNKEESYVNVNGNIVWQPQDAVDGILDDIERISLEVENQGACIESNTSRIQSIDNKLIGESQTGFIPSIYSMDRIKANAPYYFSQDEASYNGSHLDAKVRNIDGKKSFIFITDQHWDNNAKHSTDIISYIKGRCGIKNVISGGDIIGDAQANAFIGANKIAEYTEELFANFGDSALYVQGNHDTNVPAVSEWRPNTSYAVGKKVVNIEYKNCYKCVTANNDAVFDVTKWEIADLFIDEVELNKRTIDHLSGAVVFDTDGIERLGAIISNAEELNQATAWMKRHYYYDDVEQKIRYVVLETYDYGYAAHIIFGGYGTYYLQFPFLEKALKTTPNDYTIVICGHQLNSGGQMSFYTTRLYQILLAYKNKKSAKVSLRRSNTSLTDTAEPDNNGYIHAFFNVTSTETSYQYYDFTNIGTPCKIFCIGGHFHADDAFLTKITDLSKTEILYSDIASVEYNDSDFVDESLLTIYVNRDSYARPASYDSNIPNAVIPVMSQHSITEQCLDVVTIGDTIKCTRVGAGYDREFLVH